MCLNFINILNPHSIFGASIGYEHPWMVLRVSSCLHSVWYKPLLFKVCLVPAVLASLWNLIDMQNLPAFLKCLSNLNTHYLEILLKTGFGSGAWWDLRFCLSNKLSSDWNASGFCTTLDHLCSVPFQKGFVEGTLSDNTWQTSVLCFPINI